MIIGKGNLRHIAAGLLGKFISRNNNIERLWAPGVLYTEAQAAGSRVELDLLAEGARPDLSQAASVSRSFAAWLRMALGRRGFTLDVLASATVALEFGLPPLPRSLGDNSFGDGCTCTVTLASRDGKTVSYGASVPCAPHGSHVFKTQMALREAAFKLFQGIVQRSQDVDGRWSLEVLQEHGLGQERLEFDLLHERGVPSGPVTDAVARGYARLLRHLLGEWMSELGGATAAVRFFSSPRNPQGSVFVETELLTRDGRSHWFDGGGPLTSAPPWHQPTP